MIFKEVHRLKGVMGTIGASVMILCCQDIEKFAKEKNLSESFKKFDVLQDELVVLKSKLKEIV